MTTDLTVRGRIEAIRLHDINKAPGHHTYNVELSIRGVLEGTWPFPGTPPALVRVRVATIAFDALDPATRAELAPDGPRPELAPSRYGAWSTGDEVALAVAMTSPGLGHRR